MTTESSFNLSKEYNSLLSDLKTKIRSARLRAALAINQEVIKLYWDIGKEIIERKTWGNKFIERLSTDLQSAFPETSGFSIRNLQRMRQFTSHYPDFESVPQTMTQLPWGHIVNLIHKLKDETIRTWYAEQAVEHGWSRLILEH